jgi:hypothetical protein
MTAVKRSKTRYVVYKGSAIAWQIMCHVGDAKWYVHSWRGDFLPQRGCDSPNAAAVAYGLEIAEWSEHEENEERAAPGAVARARAVIGNVFGRAREHSKT